MDRIYYTLRDNAVCDTVNSIVAKHAHFIGISGVGMAAVAVLLKDVGWSISGSDEACYPPASNYLKKHGVDVSIGYSSENIPKNAELIVIGKNAKLVPETNPEVDAAFKSGVSVRSFPEVLGGLTENTNNIVVVGSYGKSTCTALMAWCMLYACKDPSYFIGARPFGFEKTAHIGKNNTFVLEGDEYPSANWDETSKFLYYHPHDVLLTSAEQDHLNIFPTQESYDVSFITLLSCLTEEGLVMVNGDESHARELAKKYAKKHITYGLGAENKWHPENIKYGKETTFDLYKRKVKKKSLKTTLLGAHNIQNIVGVGALLLERKLISPEELASGIASFKGIERRLELKTKHSNVPVYEGFGSSYQKARSAIEAMQLHFPDKRIVVIFEPHTFSWRNRSTLYWYDDVFEGAEEVFVYKPATQGAVSHDQLSFDEIVNHIIKKASVSVHPFEIPDQGVAELGKLLTGKEVVLILTSGSFDGMIEKTVSLVEKLF